MMSVPHRKHASAACYGDGFTFLYVDDVRTSQEAHELHDVQKYVGIATGYPAGCPGFVSGTNIFFITPERCRVAYIASYTIGSCMVSRVEAAAA
jgi:hypothetical protein